MVHICPRNTQKQSNRITGNFTVLNILTLNIEINLFQKFDKHYEHLCPDRDLNPDTRVDLAIRVLTTLPQVGSGMKLKN